MTPTQALLYWHTHQPHTNAIEANGRCFTWRIFTAHVARAIDLLKETGLRPGELLGVHCADPYIHLVFILAAEAIGAAHATLNAESLTPTDAVGARCARLASTIATPPLRPGQRVLHLDLSVIAESLAKDPRPDSYDRLAAAVSPGTAVRLGHTSGTTGPAKIMISTRRVIDSCIAVFDQMYPPVGPRNELICLYPLSVRGMYSEVMRAITRGCTIRFLASADLAAIARPSLAWTWLLATTAERLAQDYARRGFFLDLYFLKFLGTKISPEMHAILSATLSRQVYNPYASNEANTIAMTMPGGAGPICPGMEVMICDDAMTPLPPGEIGLIAVRGPRVIDGYLDDPVLTARQFRDGWFLMNDLGRMPTSTELEVLGRADDVLNIGGFKMVPYTAEAALRRLPGISDACLLQTQDGLGLGRLQVVLETTRAPADPQLTGAVRAIVSRSVTHFSVHCLAAFPRTPTGKVKRTYIKAALAADPMPVN